MNCKNLKIKSKKGKRYIYCNLLKKEITFNNCNNCGYKEYKIKKCTINKKYCANSKSSTQLNQKYCANSKNNIQLNQKYCVKIKGHKHKSTKATDIPMKVKKIVWERDNHRCIYCHTPVPLSCANSHYIKRSQLGLGVPENIVCACPKCHDKYDFGINIQDMINYTRNYLKSKYEIWNEEMLKYKKS